MARNYDIPTHPSAVEGYIPELAEVNFPALQEAYSDPEAVRFVAGSVTGSYLRTFPAEHHDELRYIVQCTMGTIHEGMIRGDITSAEKLQAYTTAIHNGLYGNGREEHWFKKAYSQYKAGTKANTEEAIITGLTRDMESHDFHPQIIDVGAGGGPLAARLALSERRRATAVDIIDYLDRGLPGMANVDFQLMSSATEIPHENGQFDIAILKTVLHHVEPDIQAAVMAEVRRVLKPSGMVIIEEDLYGARPDQPGYMSAFAEQETFRNFVALDPVSQRHSLAILDHHANGTVLGGKGMVLPCSYSSPAEWDEKFTASGFQPQEWLLTGFPLYRAHANSQGWATYRKAA